MEQNQIEAAKRTLNVIGEAIRDLGEVPSGHLYVHLMGLITLDQYNFFIGILKEAGLVEESRDNLLTWIGKR